MIFLILNVRQLITRPNVYVRKGSKEMAPLNVYPRDLLKKKMVIYIPLVNSHHHRKFSPPNASVLNQKFFSILSGKAYKMFDDQYMEFDNATEHCTGLAAR